MEQFLKGKVAMVTGGFTGIGLAIGRALAASGARCALGARTIRPEVVEEFQDMDTVNFTGKLDVCDLQSITEFVEKTRSQLGSIDILVNAAGISISQKICGHSEHEWQAVIDTNLTGPFRTIRACLPAMAANKWGRIINIGSTAARTARADYPAYCASKSGLLGLTRAVALEGATHGVSCVMLSPTWVETEMMQRSMAARAQRNDSNVELEIKNLASQSPQKRLVQPEEIGALAAYICRDEAFGITMEDIQINAGALW